MKKRILYTISALGLLSLLSCEKEVSFNLADTVSEKLVVEGSIETGLPPVVSLTKSFGFFSSLDLGSLQDAFISGATITVSDGSRTVNLREYAIDTLGNLYKFYSVDTANSADLSFVGESGKSYQLKIAYNGAHYESTTYVPFPVDMDSIWAAPFDIPVADHPEYRKVVVKYTDPVELGNRYRVFIKQNSRPFIAGRFSTMDDAIINGTSIELDYYNVVNPMDTATTIDRFAFIPGDTVTLKFSAIDKGTYDFWQTLDFSVGTTGNPFSTPIKVSSNISNGALGVWGGYAPSYISIIVNE